MFKFLRKLDGLLGVPIFYGVMLLSFGWWFFHWQKFRGVENWPEVEAKILEHDSYSFSVPSASYTGTSTRSVSGSYVTFEYVVEGKVYQSSYGSSNGGGLPHRPFIGEIPDRPWNESWDAYYKPGEPGLAVLSPVPYKGGIFLVIAAVCAIPVLVHLCFFMAEKIGEFRGGVAKER